MFGLSWYAVVMLVWCLPAAAVALGLVGALLVDTIRPRTAAGGTVLEPRVDRPIQVSGS